MLRAAHAWVKGPLTNSCWRLLMDYFTDRQSVEIWLAAHNQNVAQYEIIFPALPTRKGWYLLPQTPTNKKKIIIYLLLLGVVVVGTIFTYFIWR